MSRLADTDSESQAEDVIADMEMLDSLDASEMTAAVQGYTNDLKDYVFGCIVPMLNQLLTVHFPQLSWTPVQRAFSNALQVRTCMNHCRLMSGAAFLKRSYLTAVPL